MKWCSGVVKKGRIVIQLLKKKKDKKGGGAIKVW